MNQFKCIQCGDVTSQQTFCSMGCSIKYREQNGKQFVSVTDKDQIIALQSELSSTKSALRTRDQMMDLMTAKIVDLKDKLKAYEDALKFIAGQEDKRGNWAVELARTTLKSEAK